jgi:hypothetical protein
LRTSGLFSNEKLVLVGIEFKVWRKCNALLKRNGHGCQRRRSVTVYTVCANEFACVYGIKGAQSSTRLFSGFFSFF